VVKVSQKVEVTVKEVDIVRKRISLSMKSENAAKTAHQARSERTSPVRKADASVNTNNRPQAVKSKVQSARVKPQPEGDLQSKLEALKNKFK